MEKCSILHCVSYENIAKIYDILDIVHYGNICRRSSTALLSCIPDTVSNPLIAACGTGHFAAEFVKCVNPPQCTIVDISPQMLCLAKKKMEKTAWCGKLLQLQQDVTALCSRRCYDFISLNYTLNMFHTHERIEFISRLLPLLSDDGFFYVADFTTPRHGFIRLLSRINWYMCVLFFWLTTKTRWVGMGDIEHELVLAGLRILHCRYFMGGMYGVFLMKKDHSSLESLTK